MGIAEARNKIGVARVHMNERVTIDAQPVLDAISHTGLGETTTVVVIGSAARGAMSGRSDIDVLVLRDDHHRILIERPGNIHLQQESRLRFLDRLKDGDDYPGWALRFGVPIRDPDGWWAERVADELSAPHWPDWRPKVNHARKRLSIALELLGVGDVEAASEELMFAVSHIARAILLKQGVFPLSRPELPEQLMDIAPDLGRLLERLIASDSTVAFLEFGQKLLECHIEQMSPMPVLTRS